MIEAYPSRVSVRAGETLTLIVRSDERSRLRIARSGMRAEAMREHALLPVAPGEHELSLEIPATWRSGTYVAIFERPGEQTIYLDARDARALFVVRPPSPRASMLYNVPVFTYHAYNVGQEIDSDGTCLYNGGRAISLLRCGGGTGGHVWDERNVDVYDPMSPRQTYAHWDARAVAWLERNGYELDFACDVDLDGNDALLAPYRLVVGFGHHEYWTAAMRGNLERFLERGGNAAYFAGNTCFFELAYDCDANCITRAGRWRTPESETFGVSYSNGGGKWIRGRPATGFRVTDAAHWIFERTQLTNGDHFGDEERLVGYECDGHAPDAPGDCVAESDIRNWNVSDGSGEINGGRASLAITSRGGTLVAAGTTDWARVLDASEPFVTQITHNTLKRLSNTLPL